MAYPFIIVTMSIRQQPFSVYKSNREDLVSKMHKNLFLCINLSNNSDSIVHWLELEVRFCWLPAHVGFKEKGGAVRIAKKKSTRMIIDKPFGKGKFKAILMPHAENCCPGCVQKKQTKGNSFTKTNF